MDESLMEPMEVSTLSTAVARRPRTNSSSESDDELNRPVEKRPRFLPPNPDQFQLYPPECRPINEKSIVHMFLLKQTPDKREDDLPKIEDDILDFVADSFQEMMKDRNLSQLAPVQDMLKQWVDVQPRACSNKKDSIEAIRTKLECLTVGGTVPIYIRQQNCTMLFSKRKIGCNEKMRVQAFRASLPSATVMSNVDSLKMDFPERSNVIDNESMATSKIYASHIWEMTTEELPVSTVEFENEKGIKVRDASHPFLVFDWAIGILVPREVPSKSKLSISKKIRDQVTVTRGKSDDDLVLPFRRSGMWMSIKVALHLKILEVFKGDLDTAELVYKLVMLRILVDACKRYENQKHEDHFEFDVATQMMAKVGRRVDKLQSRDCKKPSIVKLMKSTVLKYALEVLTSLDQTLISLWNQESLSTGIENLKHIRHSQFKDDLVHQMDSLDTFVNKAAHLLQEPQAVVDNAGAKKQPLSFLRMKRFKTLELLCSVEEPPSNKYQRMIWLYDTEKLIKELGDASFPEEDAAKTLFGLGNRYVAEAREVYEGNPIGFSQMILVALRLTSILDQIATRKYGLLNEYKLGIKSSFECLLLPHIEDAVILDKLEDYFKHRDEGCQHPILERVVGENTFSVRFAETNDKMKELRKQIKDDIKKATKQKLKEVKRARNECRELLSGSIRTGGGAGCWCDGKRTCPPCTLKEKLETKQKVDIYERPLPISVVPGETEYLESAVVFEYLIPEEISCLRQFLAILKFELLGELALDNGQIYAYRKNCNWLEYDGLKKYNKDRKTPGIVILGSLNEPNVRLGSSAAYLQINVEDELVSKQSFIVANTMGCNYFYAKVREPVKDFKACCTFSLTKTADSKAYHGLQKYLSSTDHTQNEVLANQADCDQKLSLEEYRDFGCIRAGHRIQLRNLFIAISSPNLALDKEPVLALILQTIWQVGPRGETDCREAHLDFQSNEFVSEFLQMLEKTVNSNALNYSASLILLTAVFITARIMELNENKEIREKCHKLFQKWRELATDWCKNIPTDVDSKDDPEQIANKTGILQLQHEIQMCSMMTYYTYSPNGLDNMCKDDLNISHLLHTIHSKNLLEKLEKASNSTTSSFMTALRFTEQLIPVRLELDDQVKVSEIYQQGVFKFMEKKIEADGPFRDPKLSKKDNIIKVKVSKDNILVLDVFTGEFLKNGSPVMEFSTQFNTNKDFQRFFQNHLNFQVKRKSRSVLQSSKPFHGKTYEFRREGEKELNIVEIPEDKSQPLLVLVPHETFRGFLNDYFVDNYTHWLDPSKPVVDFRQIALTEKDYDLPPPYKLTKCHKKFNRKWLLYDETNREFLIDQFDWSIQSTGFSSLSKTLKRLELPEYIRGFMDSEMTQAGAHLPRYNLRFIRGPTGMLESLEYPGFQVSLKQDSVGTFVGLKRGILLENGVKRHIIIPHGKIKTLERSTDRKHHRTDIELEELSQPPFFIYELDDVLKRVVAKRSTASWLYLAALHATTASSLTDPFTGMTGTEMAVHILKSANVWSCSPYDMESLEILKFIYGLAPQRKYCDTWKNANPDSAEAFEITVWPVGMPSISAYEGYQYLVKGLISDSARLPQLYPGNDDYSKQCGKPLLGRDKASEKLHVRSYLRSLSKYNDQVRVEDHIVKRFSPESKVNESHLTLLAGGGEFWLDTMLKTAYIRHLLDNSISHAENTVCIQKDSLKSYLFVGALLVTNVKNTVGLSLKNLLSLEKGFLRSYWPNYYSMATSETVEDQKFSILLCALTYLGFPREQMQILHCIRTWVKSKREDIPRIPEFPIDGFDDPTQKQYNKHIIAEILMKHRDDKSSEDDYVLPNSAQMRHNAKVAKNCKKIARRWKSFWHCEEISEDEIVTSGGQKIIRNEIEMGSTGNIKAPALSEVNKKLLEWKYAPALEKFIDQVQEKLNAWHGLPAPLHQQQQEDQAVHTSVQRQTSENRKIEIDDLISQKQVDQALVQETAAIFQTGTFKGNDGEQNEMGICRSKHACEEKIEEIESAILKVISSTVSHKILLKSGLSPRLNPVNLLGLLELKDLSTVSHENNENFLQCYIGALGVLWTHLKRFNRCLHLHFLLQSRAEQSSAEHEADLKRELDNPGHEKWSPMKYPQWILVELELDIMIRKVQIQVAQQMMKMPKNGVMQLNMGEGKTTVIVPMLCSTSAEDSSQNHSAFWRVTVLSSIFKMNWNILKFAIGGLLNQRLYSFPCRRDMKIDNKCVTQMQDIYNECMEKKGVILTLPEYRLSFRLLAYDNLLKGKMTLGMMLLKTENWLRNHARDILDENDELLNVKYQLVYSNGEQTPIDGLDPRIGVCQKILDTVQLVAPNLVRNHSSLIEFDTGRASHEFAPFRLLASTENETEAVIADLEGEVVNEFLASLMLTEEETSSVKDLLCQEISQESHENAMDTIKKNPAFLNKILALVGYISRGILRLALSKRWRVDYGVDPKSSRRMAVPFRAKDVAAERTEFGHLDLAIILTHLHYYYTGLSESELNEVFVILARQPAPAAIYKEWIDGLRMHVPEKLKNFRRLNLKVGFLKSQLFSLIKKHKMVIDFWLSHVVFPKESKQFPSKLVMTAADLVYERQRLPITGFSGTNDFSELLPLINHNPTRLGSSQRHK